MEALIAIAMLCQISGHAVPKQIDAHQQACQKNLIVCYEKKKNGAGDAWLGALKDCVLERKVSCDSPECQ